jgi:hypothetical protein
MSNLDSLIQDKARGTALWLLPVFPDYQNPL